VTEPEDAPQPAEQPFTEADFVTAAEEAGRLLPALKDAELGLRSLAPLERPERSFELPLRASPGAAAQQRATRPAWMGLAGPVGRARP
jgi:hypothetical protein